VVLLLVILLASLFMLQVMLLVVWPFLLPERLVGVGQLIVELVPGLGDLVEACL
jgi:hypothetical protein